MYDLDVTDYSDPELIKAIGSSQTAETMNETGLRDDVDKFKSKIAGITSPGADRNGLIVFADKAYGRLLDYIRKRPPVQLPPTNYNIIQSQNQLSGGVHAVTTDKVVPTTNITDYKFSAGVLNPIEKRTFTKVITIDSTFRKNYETTSSNRFQWSLSQPENKVVSMKLVSLELPIMWYDISDKNNNNTFTIKLYNMQRYGDKTHLITVPSGHYNNLDMVTTLNQLFINIGEGLEYIFFSIDPVTTKSSFRVIDPEYDEPMHSVLSGNIYDPNFAHYSANFFYDISFFAPVTAAKSVVSQEMAIRKTLGWYLGFRKPKYTANNQSVVEHNVNEHEKIILHKGVILSETSYGSGRGHYIFVAVNDYNRNCLTETISSQIGDVFVGNNILGRMSLTSSPTEVMVVIPADRIFRQRDYLGPVSLSKFTIELLNKYGDLIDLNDNDFSLSLELTVVY
jgi:hypothetical protein